MTLRFVLFFVWTVAPTLEAQSLADARVAFSRGPGPSVRRVQGLSQESASRTTPVLVAGGIAGLAASAAWMLYAARNCGEWDFICGLPPFLTQPLAAPVGVRLANGRGDGLGGAVGRSYFIALLGGLLAGGLPREAVPYVVGGVAAAQLGMSVATIRNASRNPSP